MSSHFCRLIINFHAQFSLQNNCGSVTPGVLRSLVSPLGNLHSFVLGLSYSLANDDIFAALNQLPLLQELQLHYYMVCLLRYYSVSYLKSSRS